MADTFGALLRETRGAAGMSLAELARRINYSKSQVSKVENNLKPPTDMFVRLCDQVLDAGGALIAAAAPASTAEPVELPGFDDEMWVMELEETGGYRVSRRTMLAGAGALLGSALASGPATDEHALGVLRSSFDQVRALGMVSSPRVVFPQVVAQLQTLRALAGVNPEPMRTDLMLLASRVAEYAGWMSQESGNETEALWWTERAVGYAAAARDPRLASFALVRRAELAMYRHDAIATVGLARQAQGDPAAGPRVFGLAAQFEAQGHALAGDYDQYRRALDRAATLLAVREEGSAPVLGTTSAPDPVSLAAGWSLYDLGRPREAAEILDRHVTAMPPTARRARARFGVRRALAHAVGGDVDVACAVARDLLDDVARVDSATIRHDLGDLAKTLRRWHNDPAVRDLYPDLLATLNAR